MKSDESGKLSESEISLRMAQISFQAKRYNDSIRYLKEYLSSHQILNKPTRILLADSYQQIINPPRKQFRIIQSTLEHSKTHFDESTIQKLQEQIEKTRGIISSICSDFINIIDLLLSTANDIESQIFYLKFKGDYERYLCEITEGDERDLKVSMAKGCYENAMKSVGDSIKLSDPLYLGLVLNLCIFQYEIIGLKDEAIECAESSFNEAIRYLEELNDEEYKESVIILQLYRDNLSIWREERSESISQANI